MLPVNKAKSPFADQEQGAMNMLPNPTGPQRAEGTSCILLFPETALAADIRRVWNEGSANTLELAGAVSRARKQLKREWAAFWRDANIGFSKRKADMLAGIARLEGLSEQTSAHLPRGWNILHCLARLDRARLENLIRLGAVHPKLTLREAKALARHKGRSSGAGAKRPKVKATIIRFAAFVRETFPEWSLEQRQYAAAKLGEILQQIHWATLHGRRGSPLQRPLVSGDPSFKTTFQRSADPCNG